MPLHEVSRNISSARDILKQHFPEPRLKQFDNLLFNTGVEFPTIQLLNSSSFFQFLFLQPPKEVLYENRQPATFA